METDRVTLNGKERRLRYTIAERKAIESLFPRPNGAPGRLQELLAENLNPEAPGSWEVIIAFLWAGIRHESSTLSIATVEKWAEAHLAAGQHIVSLTAPVVATVMGSGILGFTVKLDQPEPTAEDPKDQAPPAVPEAVKAQE